MVPVITYHLKCGLQAIQDIKHALFLSKEKSCPCMQMCSLRLVSRFTYGTQNCFQSDWSFLFFPSLFWRCLQFFSRNKLMIPIVLFQSLWMFFWWLVFTSYLISQTTWLKVKLELVNFPRMHSLAAFFQQVTRPNFFFLWQVVAIKFLYCLQTSSGFQSCYSPKYLASRHYLSPDLSALVLV